MPCMHSRIFMNIQWGSCICVCLSVYCTLGVRLRKRMIEQQPDTGPQTLVNIGLGKANFGTDTECGADKQDQIVRSFCFYEQNSIAFGYETAHAKFLVRTFIHPFQSFNFNFCFRIFLFLFWIPQKLQLALGLDLGRDEMKWV